MAAATSLSVCAVGANVRGLPKKSHFGRPLDFAAKHQSRDGLSPRVNAELLLDSLNMEVSRRCGDAEQLRDFVIGFADGGPLQASNFPIGQSNIGLIGLVRCRMSATIMNGERH